MNDDAVALQSSADRLWIELGVARVNLHHAVVRYIRTGEGWMAVAEACHEANMALAEWNRAIAAADAAAVEKS